MSLANAWQEAVSGHHRGPSARLLSLGLRVLAPLYGAGARVHREVYDRGVLRRHTFDCPVLSVGNVTIGGTGKTSAVILLARTLLERGVKPAILFRGHRRSSGETVILVGGSVEEHGVDEAGDEACMVAQMLPEAVVAVGKHRRAVARQVLAETDARALILDDGFQHHPLARDLDIVLLDALWPGTADRLFPAGTLREPLCNLRRADALWLTHVDVAEEANARALRQLAATKQHAPIETRYQPLLLRRPGADVTEEPAALRGQTVGALSSIGNPLAFEMSLQRLGAGTVRPLRFPDHHRYSTVDLERIKLLADEVDVVVTTEKDAVRLSPTVWQLDNVWVLRCEMQFVRGEDEAVRMVDECLDDRL